jgi:hypothetical protein
MTAREGCLCPTEPGPVDGFVCLCEGGTWNCQITSKAASVCRDACLDAGAPAAGPTGSCDLTNQLTVSNPTIGGDTFVEGELSIAVTLTNRGPRDHNDYPGIVVTTDMSLWTLTFGTNAVYALRAGESVQLGLTLEVPRIQACFPIHFHIRAHSFGSEANCPGESVDASTVLSRSAGDPCP